MYDFIVTPEDEIEELIDDHETRLKDYYDSIQFEMWLEQKMFEDIIASEPKNNLDEVSNYGG